jgi:hypothetical protein
VIPIEQQFAAHRTDGEVFTERDMRRLLAAGQGRYGVRVSRRQRTAPVALATAAATTSSAGWRRSMGSRAAVPG